MGTDVYMQWKEQTKEDKEKQFVGFSCDAGDVGYLRASIGMVRENRILRVLFPGYWEGRNDTPYDFNGNFEKMMRLAIPYFSSCASGAQFELSEDEKSLQRAQGTIFAALKNAGWSEEQISRPGSDEKRPAEELAFGISWFHSLIEFFYLGIEKQDKGMKPYPHISW